MACLHANPAHYAFCSSCGEPLARRRCRCCGAAAAMDARYCGRCGEDLDASVAQGSPVSSSDGGRYDLAALLEVAHSMRPAKQEQQLKVDQDDIRRLLSGVKKDS